MTSHGISTPPSKRRKTNSTHASQSVFSRALQVVKDAVPSSLISLHHSDLATISDEHRHGPLRQPSIDACEGEAEIEEQSHAVNGVSSNGAERARNEGRRIPDQSTPRRTSKRLRDRIETDATTLQRKRRKYKTEMDTEGLDEFQIAELNSKGLDELQTAEELNSKGLDELQIAEVNSKGLDEFQIAEVNSKGLDELQTAVELNTTMPSASCNKTPQHKTHHQSIENDDKPYNERSGLHTRGKRSSSRTRRVTGRLPLDMADSSPVKSTPRKSKTPKTLSTTPGRKRGRPPKQAIATPTSHNAEESELGFREIPPEARKSASGQAKSLRRSGTLSQKQQNRRQESLSYSGEDIWDPFNDADGALHAKTRAEQQRQTTSTKTHEGALHAHDAHQDEAYDEHQIDLEVPERLRESSDKLQRILQLSSVESVDSFKSHLLRGLTGRHPLVNMDDEYRKVQQLVTQTVLAGEGNSMLVIGPRGCGKTALVETVLSDITHEHRDAFITVRLNGFIHTDDKLALREVWRQLGREIAADEDTDSMRANYADTLTSLLALLAHSPEEEGKIDEISRSVVFVIDEFDLFASHPRQTLLYNLFDVAQSRNAPIAVLGLTTRTDIVESLEKRVKSRFGQRYVHLTHPRTFQSFREMCKSAMISHESKLLDRPASEMKCRGAWNEYVEGLFASDDRFESALRHLFARSKCVPTFLAACYLVVCQLSPSSIPTGASFIEQLLLPPDSKLQHLASLSDMELSLLIAGARLDVILDTDVCNFSMVYDEYVQLASRVKAQGSAAGQTAVGGGARVWGKGAAQAGWEKLVELELVLPVSTGDGSRGMCRIDVALEEIGPMCPRMGAAMSKWCREI